MLPDLVLQEGDPSAQFVIGKLGSVVQERCGGGWFIDVKEHENELARRFGHLISAHFEESQLPPHGTVPCNDDCDSYSREKVLNLYHAVPSHIGDYAVKVLLWHPDALLELGIDTYRSLFERYFLFWLEILYAFSSGDADRDALVYNTLLKVISLVNAEVTDQRLHTYVYHAFTFWEHFTGLSTDLVNPAHVYTHAMATSPSANFICRDWGLSSVLVLGNLAPISMGPEPFYSGGSALFDVDVGRMPDPSPPSILSCFPNLPFHWGSGGFNSGSDISFDASGQIIRLAVETHHGNGPEYSLDSTQYEIIKRPSRDPQDAMIFNVDDDDDCDHRADNSNTKSMFISIANAQTSRHDNYLLPAIGEDSTVVHYAHGLLVIDKRSGLMLKIEPDTTGCREWMILDSGANGVDTFAVMEDGSRQDLVAKVGNINGYSLL
ncbi:hypothetical protein EV421DRAFT_1907090 [Armillaria borealis]|uniref:Uncharacterized protein n=1 Tax=Armillaria borealis TaxID=47425 RepID=A0AA39J8Y3_9AGAR|nr:hypothetical protein EV421DRAFT_1907090 [Armillaria borealis]